MARALAYDSRAEPHRVSFVEPAVAGAEGHHVRLGDRR